MSFPYLSDLIKWLTGLDLPLPLPMFGLCVASAMLVASTLLARELERLYQAGRIGAATVRQKSSAGLAATHRAGFNFCSDAQRHSRGALFSYFGAQRSIFSASRRDDF